MTITKLKFYPDYLEKGAALFGTGMVVKEACKFLFLEIVTIRML